MRKFGFSSPQERSVETRKFDHRDGMRCYSYETTTKQRNEYVKNLRPLESTRIKLEASNCTFYLLLSVLRQVRVKLGKFCRSAHSRFETANRLSRTRRASRLRGILCKQIRSRCWLGSRQERARSVLEYSR